MSTSNKVSSKIHIASFKCKGCFKVGDLDEYNLCSDCYSELDPRELGICLNCDNHEIVNDGNICERCEKDGIRCSMCNVWEKVRTVYRGGEMRINPHIQCTKCLLSFCFVCEPKHMSRACWSCAKVECPKLIKKCKICKKNLCSDCSETKYCNTCVIRLIARRRHLQIPKDILTVLRGLIQGKQPNTFLKSKCEHEDVYEWDRVRCAGCQIYMCWICKDNHSSLCCSKCGTSFCGNMYWRTCNVCSRIICNRCSNVGEYGTCPCKDLYVDEGPIVYESEDVSVGPVPQVPDEYSKWNIL